MKKRYKKPNICVVTFDILDLILTSGEGEWEPGNGGGWGWDDPWGDDPGKSGGGYDPSAF